MSKRRAKNQPGGQVQRMELQALLARVEAATGADRELDEAITRSFGIFIPIQANPLNWRSGPHVGGFDVSRSGPGGSTQDRYVERYTASLDAALALVERVLPGWGCTITLPLGGGGYAQVFDSAGREYDLHGAVGALSDWIGAGPCHSPTPALALLAALLTALSHQQPHDQIREGEGQ